MSLNSSPLTNLGWSAFFSDQLDPDIDAGRMPARIASVHRSRVETLGQNGPMRLFLPSAFPAGDLAVGDWLLTDGSVVLKRLERQSLLRRHAAGKGIHRQLIAANLNTLLIVTSCNADFNPARLERYLALAASAGVEPVILLTKADECEKPDSYRLQALALSSGLTVLALDARAGDVASRLQQWCGPGQTIALLGSSGVGKSTLANSLTGGGLATQAIREDDAKGRHTTTARFLLPMQTGGWVIDTPGMRELRLTDASDGIDAVFDDLTTLATQCHFRDCSHTQEPGCAILAAIEDGTLDSARVRRWEKLRTEDSYNSETLAEARARYRSMSKTSKSAQKSKPKKR